MPRGHFTLKDHKLRPLVMTAAGIGMTPILSMIDFLADPRNKNPKQKIIFNLLAIDQEYCWYNNVKRLVSEAGINIARPRKGQLQKIEDNLQKSYRKYWADRLDDCDDDKMRSVRKFKIQFGAEKYLDQTQGTKRSNCIKFRIADHNLDSNSYSNDKKDKICRNCNSGIVGNEIHCFQCQNFMDARIKCDIEEKSYTEIIKAIKVMDGKSCSYISEIINRTKYKSRVYQ